MGTYFDTSVLIKLYVREVNSPEALTIIRANRNPVPFSHAVELELRTGIRLKHGRGEITAAQRRGALRTLETDLAKGVLARPACDLDSIYRRAETISAKYAADTRHGPPTSGTLRRLWKSDAKPLLLSMSGKGNSRPLPGLKSCP